MANDYDEIQGKTKAEVAKEKRKRKPKKKGRVRRATNASAKQHSRLEG